ncbi:amidase [Streptomyces albiaxialis]|uniref:Amidase n=1 Tax=Streptomyces albiaxialis TaxID=329523 RepID=A0ABN2VRN1_9ACTN
MERTPAAGTGTPAALDALCEAIEAHDPELRAFVADAETYAQRRRRLRGELRAARDRWPREAGRPPLFGVPVAVKDIVRVDGLPTRGGSRLPAGTFAGRQASAVDRLRHAGALVAGKTVTAEFAMSAPGPTRNPHDHARTPGGSSSGSAAAVAAGLVPLALGTQTLGSVIRPAAYCGVVGLKPTVGRVPYDGVIPNAPTLDTLGLFAASLTMATTAAAVLCDGWRAGGTGGEPPVLGVPDGPYLDRAGEEARTAFERQAAALAAAGLTVRRVPLFADFARTADDVTVLNRYEAARSHADWFPRHGALYRERSAATVREGRALSRDAYERARSRRTTFRRALREATDAAGVDIWLSPAATGPAPRSLDTTGDPVMCLPWSWAGWPALSLPAGRAADGLPLGLQCAARPGHDEALLAWAGRLRTSLTPDP